MGSNPILPNIHKPSLLISTNYNFLVSKKTNFKTVIFNYKNFELIYVLYRIGAISNFTIIRSKKLNIKYVKFSIFFYKNIPFFKTILQVSTFSKNFNVSLKTLKLVNSIFKSSHLILSTTCGVLTAGEAVKRGVGGLLLYILL